MVIQVNELVKRYKDVLALDNISFDVKKGEILGLLGPNGSGKTTTINCILSLLSYDKGDIKIFDKPMKPNAYDIKKDIGIVLQEVAVVDELNVYENIDYFCGLYISDKNLRKQYVDQAMEFVKISDYAKFYPKKLSGGLLRRLNIACGIAHKPKLIILDEPTVAVDPQSRNYILEGIKKLNEDGATIIYTSHYMDEVEYLCDRIIIIDNGQIIAQGTKETLKQSIKNTEKIIFDLFEISENHLNLIQDLDKVVDVSFHDNQLVITLEKSENNLVMALAFMQDHKIDFNKVASETISLNDVFLQLTGKELRD